MTPDLERLFHLQERARSAESPDALGFVMVNETRSLLPYRQAVSWDADGRPSALSGVSAPEPLAPFTQWLRGLYRGLSDSGAAAGPLSKQAVGETLLESWSEWLPARALWLPFRPEIGGALLYARDEPWGEDEVRLLSGLAESYGDAVATFPLRRSRRPARQRRLWRRRSLQAAVLAVVLCGGFLPVPLTVLAPAEIVAADPEVVRAPLDGVVARIHVRPNGRVAAGQALFDLDDAALRSKLAVAEKALGTARAEYEQSRQKALVDAREKARLVGLAGRAQERAAEVDYLAALLERVRVTATRGGIAVVDDPSEWLGRPVTIGERVMVVAEARDTEVEAWLPVGDAVDLEPGAPVTLFLNAAPLRPLAAHLRYAAHRAQPRPDGTLAYRIRAEIQEGAERPRLGLKGTARIEAGRTTLAYWLLRRPLASLRQSLGI